MSPNFISGAMFHHIDTGVRVLAIGLAIHLIALTIFAAYATLFAIALRTRHHILDATYASVYSSRLFRAFLTGFSAATLLILLRTAFWVVAVAEGFQSSVAQAEVGLPNLRRGGRLPCRRHPTRSVPGPRLRSLVEGRLGPSPAIEAREAAVSRARSAAACAA
ncbi:hypothetical protein DL768_009770 [Monosporascus sp. mg162]|nr:hypothetical protein DL768_009770 [Monosporascus sp. mg162]